MVRIRRLEIRNFRWIGRLQVFRAYRHLGAPLAMRYLHMLSTDLGDHGVASMMPSDGLPTIQPPLHR